MEAKNTLIDAREMAELNRLPISSIWRGCRNGAMPIKCCTFPQPMPPL